MRIATSSRLIERFGLVEGAQRLQKLGYDGIEIWYEHIMRFDSAKLAQLREIPLDIYVHAASRDVNLTSTNPRIAAVSQQEVERSIDLASMLGASVVVVHPGTLSSSKDHISMYMDRQVSIFQDLCARADEQGTSVVVENMEARPKEVLVTALEMTSFLSYFSPNTLGFCLDIAHAFTVGHIEQFLEPELQRYVRHIHLSNSEEGKTHVPLLKGKSLITPQVLNFLRTLDVPVVIEGYDGAEEPQKLIEENLVAARNLGL